MAHYTLYRDDIETLESDEKKTHDKIIELMTEGMHLVRKESGANENVRISHAKAFGLLKGELIVEKNLPSELAQVLFAQPGTRHANEDFDVSGPKLPGHTGETKDFVFDTGKKFTSDNEDVSKTFKVNAKIVSRLFKTIEEAIANASRIIMRP